MAGIVDVEDSAIIDVEIELGKEVNEDSEDSRRLGDVKVDWDRVDSKIVDEFTVDSVKFNGVKMLSRRLSGNIVGSSGIVEASVTVGDNVVEKLARVDDRVDRVEFEGEKMDSMRLGGKTVESCAIVEASIVDVSNVRSDKVESVDCNNEVGEKVDSVVEDRFDFSVEELN